MENQIHTATVTHTTQNGRYRVVFERAASSTNGILGWKVESNSDSKNDALADAEWLKLGAEAMTMAATEQPEEAKHE